MEKSLPGTVRVAFCLLGAFALLGSAVASAEEHNLFRDVATGQIVGDRDDDPTVVRDASVVIDMSVLGSVDAPAEMVALNLFEDAAFVAIFERVETNALGSFAWIGRLEGIEYGEAILVVTNGVLAGNVSMPGETYEITHVGNGVHAIKELDQSFFPPELDPVPAETVDELPSENAGGLRADACDEITVLVAYSPEARAADGGTGNMEARIALAVVETNQSYVNSGLTQRVNLVYTLETLPGDAANAFYTDLPALADTGDGIFEDVDAARETYYADEVVLIIQDSSYCGLGYLNSTASSAFSVVHRTCATGYYSFAHEMGHNMGARHDWYIDDSNNSDKGFINVADSWRTIMAYNTLCSDQGGNCSRLKYWSNPDVTYGSPPDPMGVPTTGPNNCNSGSTTPDPSTCRADNRNRLNGTCSAVANFRVAPLIDCNTNGIADDLDISGGTSLDCNTSGVPDECELVGNDCNTTTIPDDCELAGNDCNSNAMPDECELIGNDCNTNITPDDCELLGNDCNGTHVPDECELAGNDCNSNGTHDACELAPSVGSLVGWGDDGAGQATVPVGDNYVAASAGFEHSLALRADGAVEVWGDDTYGQATAPSGSDFVAVAAGHHHSLALHADGTLEGWGRDNYGQATVPAGSDYVAIAAGGYHNLAIHADGSLEGWGFNSAGQAWAPAGNDFVAIAAGLAHSLALHADGTLEGWGADSSGQATSPAGGFVAIAAGGNHSVAVRGDGTLQAWGNDNDGQSTVPPGNDFVAGAGGGFHSLALRMDGSLAGWGRNTEGQTSVPGGNDFAGVAAGYTHSLAKRFARYSGDCNTNGLLDECDIEGGTSLDVNTNGTPDECECMATAMRSYRIHGAAGELGLDLAVSGGIEPRQGGIFSLEIDLDSDPGDVLVTAVDCAPTAWTGTVPFSAVSMGGGTVSLDFVTVLPGQSYCLIELACGASVCVRNCEGDLNLSGSTTAADYLQTKIRLGNPATDANCEWDFNRSGSVTTADALEIKIRVGFAAPECP